MTVWLYSSIVGYIGAFALAAFSLPVPQFMHSWIDRMRCAIAHGFLALHLWPRSFRVVDFLFLCATALSALELFYVEKIQARVSIIHNPAGEGHGDLMEKVIMFRTQRNWWIALFNVAIYYSLSRCITMLEEATQMREQIEKEKTSKSKSKSTE